MDQRSALVTDALHFIGASSATALANAGFRVFCQDAAFVDAEVRRDFETRHPGLVVLAAQEAADLHAETFAAAGPLDVLVHNDAYPADRVPIEEADADAFRTALEALVVRAFERTGAFVPDMKKRGSGKIIFVTSAAPLRGLANYAIYVSARGAANSLAKTLAVELARDNIQVNAVAPNFIESPTYFPASLMEDPKTAARILKNIPLGRLGRQEEAAGLVAYLASPEADFLTGHVFPIAGGWA
ncbi:MAG: SDR family oxidoreductase [Acidobacteriota bacterium]|nr:SDR family oxidoreductase [Acidobacteriota bacterium]